jgi:hypothetical protein
VCLGLLNEQNLIMDVDWKSKHTDAGNIWPTRFDPNASSYTHTHTDIREWNIDCNLTLVLCVRFDSDAGGRSPPNQFGQKIKKTLRKQPAWWLLHAINCLYDRMVTQLILTQQVTTIF